MLRMWQALGMPVMAFVIAVIRWLLCRKHNITHKFVHRSVAQLRRLDAVLHSLAPNSSACGTAIRHQERAQSLTLGLVALATPCVRGKESLPDGVLLRNL